MRAELTPAVLRAVERAGSDLQILLLALLEEEEGRAAQWLMGCGVSLPICRDTLQKTPLKSAFALEKLIPGATALALQFTGEYAIGGDHLLLAVVCHEPDVQALLQACGVNLTMVTALAESEQNGLAVGGPLDPSPPNEQVDTAPLLHALPQPHRATARGGGDY